MTGEPLVVEVRGLAVRAFHGVHEHERRDGQRFLFDIWAIPHSDRACETDELADAVSYGEIARLVAALATRERFDLLERLAAFLCDALLERFPLSAVAVTVHKPDAPIALELADIAVTVRREAPAASSSLG